MRKELQKTKDEIINGQSCSSSAALQNQNQKILLREIQRGSRFDTGIVVFFIHSSDGGAEEEQCGVAASRVSISEMKRRLLKPQAPQKKKCASSSVFLNKIR